MSEKIAIASAKTAKDLAGVYAKVKNDAKGYGFTSVAALREEVVGKAMTEKKKPADFIVEVETSKFFTVQLAKVAKQLLI